MIELILTHFFPSFLINALVVGVYGEPPSNLTFSTCAHNSLCKFPQLECVRRALGVLTRESNRAVLRGQTGAD